MQWSATHRTGPRAMQCNSCSLRRSSATLRRHSSAAVFCAAVSAQISTTRSHTVVEGKRASAGGALGRWPAEFRTGFDAIDAESGSLGSGGEGSESCDRSTSQRQRADSLMRTTCVRLMSCHVMSSAANKTVVR